MSECGTPDIINSAQLEVMRKIQNYGKNHGFSQEQIMHAMRVAAIESNLGQNTTGEDGNYLGLFQYDRPTWNERHAHLGDINSIDSQISAFFNDINKFTARWNDVSNKNIPRDDMTLWEYLYSKHHDGANFDRWFNENGRYQGSIGTDLYNSRCFEPDRIPDMPSSGGMSSPGKFLIPKYETVNLGRFGDGHNCRPYSKMGTEIKYDTDEYGFMKPVITIFGWFGMICTEDGDQA